MKKHEFLPDLPPPANTRGMMGWLLKNLFSSPLNAIMTLIVAYLVCFSCWEIFNWAILNANWIGSTRDACTKEGACWVFISVRFEQFMFGFYPEAELWRPKLFYATLAVLVALLAYDKTPKRGWIFLFTVTIYPILAGGLLEGEMFGLKQVATHQWGGLLVT